MTWTQHILYTQSVLAWCVLAYSPWDGNTYATTRMVESSHVARLGRTAQVTHIGGCLTWQKKQHHTHSCVSTIYVALNHGSSGTKPRAYRFSFQWNSLACADASGNLVVAFHRFAHHFYQFTATKSNGARNTDIQVGNKPTGYADHINHFPTRKWVCKLWGMFIYSSSGMLLKNQIIKCDPEVNNCQALQKKVDEWISPYSQLLYNIALISSVQVYVDIFLQLQFMHYCMLSFNALEGYKSSLLGLNCFLTLKYLR